MRTRRISLLVVAVLGVALPLLPLRATADAAEPPLYVALGDSFAAGPLIPMQEEPWGCLKSTNNYANHLANRLGAQLRDATCSGASTRHMWETHGVSPEKEFGRGGNPPQFDRLDANVDLVTVQIGGNDIGFGGIAETCVRAGASGQACRDSYLVDGRDILRERIAIAATRVGNVFAGAAAKAPNARIFALGYSSIFNVSGKPDCPNMLVGEGDAEYLRGIQVALNEMIAQQAALHGARYVDVYGPSAGHTACDAPVVRWVEPVVPVNAAAPIHPNLTGMLAVAGLLEQAVRTEADMEAALTCPATPADAPWVLLVHGTGATASENWSWNYQPDLAARGFGVCLVRLPDRSLNDIQVSADYVAHAIRRMHALSGRRVHVLGHSQGGLSPRWAMRWNPDLRSMVDDVIQLAAPNQGTTAAGQTVNGYTCEACHQMQPGSSFIAALNSWNESPGDAVSYTSIWTQYDELVQPPANANLGVRNPGNGNFANIRIQDLGGFCAFRTVDHGGIAGDAVAHALVLDALTNPGPASRTRVAARAAALCSSGSFTSSPSQMRAATETSFAAIAAQWSSGGGLTTNARYGTAEPALAPYVRASALELSAPVSVPATDAIDVGVTLTDRGGAPLAGRPVTVSLGGASAHVTTGPAGTATALLTADLDAGPAVIAAVFAGDGSDGGYRSAFAGSPITIVHETTTLTYEGATDARGGSIVVAARLAEDDGPAVAGRTIVFTVQGREVSVVTDADGLAATEVAVPDHGRSQQVDVRFAGDARYAGSSTSSTVTWGGKKP